MFDAQKWRGADITQSIYPPVIRLASDLKVFDLLKDAEGASKSSVELAKAAGADVRLMSAPPQVSILGITDKVNIRQDNEDLGSVSPRQGNRCRLVRLD